MNSTEGKIETVAANYYTFKEICEIVCLFIILNSAFSIPNCLVVRFMIIVSEFNCVLLFGRGESHSDMGNKICFCSVSEK